MKAMKAMKVMSDGRWRRKCKMCAEVKTAWVEMTVVEEGPAKFVMCETCIRKALQLEYWGIKIHRIANKQEFLPWIIEQIKIN